MGTGRNGSQVDDSKAVIERDYQETINAVLNMKSDNISMYDKARVFDEVLYKI